MSIPIQQRIAEALKVAFGTALSISPDSVDPVIRRAQKAEIADFQANGAMALAKKHGQNPKELAELVVEVVDFENFDILHQFLLALS